MIKVNNYNADYLFVDKPILTIQVSLRRMFDPTLVTYLILIITDNFVPSQYKL